MNKQYPTSESRRRFLTGVVVGSGAVAGAALTGSAVAVTQANAAPDRPAAAEPKQRGYHETAHIRRYYELARR